MTMGLVLVHCLCLVIFFVNSSLLYFLGLEQGLVRFGVWGNDFTTN